MSAQVIGYLGENGVRDVRIPIGHLLDKWPGLRPSLVMVPVGGSDDEAYPVQYTMDGTDLVWHVSDEDTAVAGTTKAAVRMVDDGGRVGKDEPFQVIISPNLSSGGEPPVVIKPWVDKLITLVPRAEEAAKRAENAAQNWENGTASNSNKLGGKQPEYYLPAVQLLDNPDFAIAQAGYNSLHGNEYFCADRWNGTNNEIKLSKNVGYITLTSTADYRQIHQKILVSDLVNDAYTFAVTRRSASVASSLHLYGENANGNVTTIKSVTMSTGSAWKTFVLNFTRAEVAQYTKIWCCISNEATGAVDYKEPCLYPATYNAETLPPFVQPDPLTELEKCQYYFRRLKGTAYATIGVGLVRLTHRADFFIPLGKMRIDNVSIYTHGSFAISIAGGSVPAQSIAIDFLARSNSGIVVNVESDGHVLSSYVGQGGLLQANNDANAYIDINADL